MIADAAARMSELELRIAGAVNDSIVDGPGIRLAIFTQGCTHACPGCHNPETHDPEGGYVKTVDQILAAIEGNPLLDGVTFSGGEPMLQPDPLIEIAKAAHDRGLNVWCYSGYTIDEIQADKPHPHASQLLDNIDVLIDGPFLIDQRSLDLKWKGSANQRVIDVPATLSTGEVVLKA